MNRVAYFSMFCRTHSGETLTTCTKSLISPTTETALRVYHNLWNKSTTGGRNLWLLWYVLEKINKKSKIEFEILIQCFRTPVLEPLIVDAKYKIQDSVIEGDNSCKHSAKLLQY